MPRRKRGQIFYFTPVSRNQTKVTIVGLGCSDTEQSKEMRTFFEAVNKYSMDQLRAAMKLVQASKPK
jgi:phenylpropionate dioxygenase-like ring-hydroxylating dioxygenase large terminal subunit